MSPPRAPINCDDERTWPPAVLEALESAAARLRAHEAFEIDLTERYDSDEGIVLRCFPPPNPHQDVWDDVLQQIRTSVRSERIVGYHCTRLVHHEIEHIRSAGLHLLSGELVESKIAALIEDGTLPSAIGARLLTNSVARGPETFGRRRGMTWFLFTSTGLREESGVLPLLSFWGGEGIYWLSIDDAALAERLRSIGTACIVEAAVPVACLKDSEDLGERLLRCFLGHRNIPQEQDHDWESYAVRPVAGEHVTQIITRDDEAFERLTQCSTWESVVT